MIKKRLVGLLSHAKKYIVYQVVWQWLALLCQILLIFCGTALLAEGLLQIIRSQHQQREDIRLLSLER